MMSCQDDGVVGCVGAVGGGVRTANRVSDSPRPAQRQAGSPVPRLIGTGLLSGGNFEWQAEVAGLDYYSASGPVEAMQGVLGRLREWFGEPERCRGRYVYADRWRWGNGTELLFTEDREGTNAEHCYVSLPGGALAEWEPAERLDRTRELFDLGLFRVRRADLPVDFRGRGITLLDQVEAAVERKELCGVRSFSRIRPKVACRGGLRLTGDTVYLGKRGNGSFSVCGYDKGLEQSRGKGQAGEWVRWEPRFEGDMAQAVMSRLWAARVWEREHVGQQLAFVLGPSWKAADSVVAQDWKAEYVKVAMSCVDFREARVGKNRSWARRRRAAWWCAVLGQVEPVRLRLGKRRYPTLSSAEGYLRRCCFPILKRMMEVACKPVQEVVGDLGFDRVRPGRRSQAAYEYAARLARAVA